MAHPLFTHVIGSGNSNNSTLGIDSSAWAAGNPANSLLKEREMSALLAEDEGGGELDVRGGAKLDKLGRMISDQMKLLRDVNLLETNQSSAFLEIRGGGQTPRSASTR